MINRPAFFIPPYLPSNIRPPPTETTDCWRTKEYLNHGLLNSVPGFRVEGVCFLFRFDFQNIAVRPNYLGCFIFIKFPLGKVKCTGTN